MSIYRDLTRQPLPKSIVATGVWAARGLLNQRPGCRIIVNSFPKCGTHAVAMIIRDLTGLQISPHILAEHSLKFEMIPKVQRHAKLAALSQPVVMAHLRYDLDTVRMFDRNDIFINVKRDPLEVLFSYTAWIQVEKKFVLHEHFANRSEAYIRNSLVNGFQYGGRRYFPPLFDQMTLWTPWQERHENTTISFEDIIADQGSGEGLGAVIGEKYPNLVQSLVNLTGRELRYGASRTASSTSATFIKGRGAKSLTAFTLPIKERRDLLAQANPILDKWGYLQQYEKLLDK
ncbi:sulfotransferase domain-containing protein [Sphingomonas sp.]|uniref:sulfotransferase domain-containing protein n=1 Tax=Sphingomonas sp. TaxID=28214 RepID=UPI0035C7A3F0